MSSVFIKTDNHTVKGLFGKEEQVPVYLQFVPGIVVDVVTSKNCEYYKGSRSINSVIALPHITTKTYQRRSTVNEENRYFPMFRGITDVPAKGDPVLLCTMGQVNYYMGPLNTQNSPNFNEDPSMADEPIVNSRFTPNIENNPKYRELTSFFTGPSKKGESINFDKTPQSRLSKPISKPDNSWEESLDHPRAWNTEEEKIVVPLQDDGYPFGRAVNELHGDLMFEGRHGNSIRLGSRYVDPYIFISNDRPINN